MDSVEQWFFNILEELGGITALGVKFAKSEKNVACALNEQLKPLLTKKKTAYKQ